MPTFERLARFDREFRRLPRELQRALLAMLPGAWEVTFAPDGRATFSYGDEIRPGEPHVIWRRVGTHDVLGDP